MFTFEDLLTVPQQGIREIVGAADKKVLAMALKGGKENVKAHLFPGDELACGRDDEGGHGGDGAGAEQGCDIAAQQELLATAKRLERGQDHL